MLKVFVVSSKKAKNCYDLSNCNMYTYILYRLHLHILYISPIQRQQVYDLIHTPRILH